MQHTSTLCDIGVNQSATVCAIQCDDSMRRRLLDIGLTPHTNVMCLGSSPAGDPRAYLIRGAVIAIRADDAKHILLQ